MTLRREISNILENARKGHHVSDDDLGSLPAVLHDAVREASARVVALRASGDQLAAVHEVRQAMDEIADLATQERISLQGPALRARSAQPTSSDPKALAADLPRH